MKAHRTLNYLNPGFEKPSTGKIEGKFAEFIQDSGREGNEECYARFVFEGNGLTSSNQSVTLCPNP